MIDGPSTRPKSARSSVGALFVALVLAFGLVEAVPALAGVDRTRAADLVDQLTVKGRAPKTGYSRGQFGPAWSDVDRNGCDTRDDILNRDLSAKQWRAGTHGCVVIRGVLADPYTGRAIPFSKTDASAVPIDHVVALSGRVAERGGGMVTGAAAVFANDPLNLLAVDREQLEQVGRRHRDVAAAEQAVPVPLRRPPGRGQGEVPPLGDAAEARRDAPRAGHVPRATRAEGGLTTTPPAARATSATVSYVSRR